MQYEKLDPTSNSSMVRVHQSSKRQFRDNSSGAHLFNIYHNTVASYSLDFARDSFYISEAGSIWCVPYSYRL